MRLILIIALIVAPSWANAEPAFNEELLTKMRNVRDCGVQRTEKAFDKMGLGSDLKLLADSLADKCSYDQGFRVYYLHHVPGGHKAISDSRKYELMMEAIKIDIVNNVIIDASE